MERRLGRYSTGTCSVLRSEESQDSLLFPRSVSINIPVGFLRVMGTKELLAHSFGVHTFQIWTKMMQKKWFIPLHSSTHRWMCWALWVKQWARQTTHYPHEDYGRVGKMDFNQIITRACDEGHSGKAEVVMKGCNIEGHWKLPQGNDVWAELKGTPELSMWRGWEEWGGEARAF